MIDRKTRVLLQIDEILEHANEIRQIIATETDADLLGEILRAVDSYSYKAASLTRSASNDAHCEINDHHDRIAERRAAASFEDGR